MIVLFMYIIGCLSSLSYQAIYKMYLEYEIKRRGYKRVEEEITEEKMNSDLNSFKWFLILTFFPPTLLYVIYVMLNMKSFVNDEIKDLLNDNKIEMKKNILDNPKIEQKYLENRINEIKKIQSKSMMNNYIRSYSDFSTDEKIMFLLRELEKAYREKALEEGIDLDSEIAFCKEDEIEQKKGFAIEEERNKILSLKNPENND